MISSKFVLDVLDLLLDSDEYGLALRPQIPYLTDTKYEYTGVGLYVTFQAAEGIKPYKHPEDRIVLDRVTLTSSELAIGASAIVFANQGIIDYLEISSFDGEYPKRELADYVLKQEPGFGSGKEIRRP